MAEAAEVGEKKSKTIKKAAAQSGDLEAIQSEVASFAAQLGLGVGGGGAGFDDSDFRKTGRIGEKKKKTPKKQEEHNDSVAGKKSPAAKGTSFAAKGMSVAAKGTSPAAKGKSGEKSPAEKGKKGKKSEDLGLQFDSSKKSGKKRALPSDIISGEEKSAKKERFSEGESKNDPSKFVVALDKSLAKTFQSAALWYEGLAAAAENPKATTTSSTKDVVDGEAKRKEAEQVMEKAVADYEKSRSKDSDTRWLMTARRSGTSQDKVAAMTVMLQDSPMLNLRTLDALVGMVTSKGGKRHAAIGIEALRELFLRSLLPDRKLKYLNQQPLSTLADSKEGAALLLHWYFEDSLKRRYERFIGALEEATKDTLPFLKEKALKTVFELLKAKPEQERRLLSALVNKLGDPERKVASNASYLLSSLLTAHPVMKTVVVEEVDSFLFRPHVGNRARYYAAVFLNQIMLSNRGDGPNIAKQLINLYFALFRTVTLGDSKADTGLKEKKKPSKHDKRNRKLKAKEKNEKDAPQAEEINTRLLSALLTGVNRAFPYVASDDVNSVIEEHTPVLFRLVHSDNFNVAVQALMLLHQLLLKNEAISDRFYRALYSVLLSPSLTTSNKAEMFLNLLFKALKGDINLRRMAAFAKRLAQVALQQPPNFSCGCLLILSEIIKARPSLWDGILQPESKDDEVELFVDISDEEDATPGSNGASEEKSGSASDEEDDMVDRSIPGLEDDHSSDEEGDKKRSKSAKPKAPPVKKKEVAGTPAVNVSEEAEQKTWPVEGYYDSRHRDPSYCNADRACWWELTALASHMHPSVASMARTLLSGSFVVYSGDPLRDLVLGAFLDRFAEKKPKTRKQKEDGSMPMSGTEKTVVKRLIGEELLVLDENEVAPDDVVFHKFYQTKVSNRKVKKAKQKKDEEDDDITGLDEVDGDDSDEDEVDALLDRDEGREMGSEGEEDEELDDEESDGEFDYDKMEHTFDMEEDEELDGEDSDIPSKQEKKQKKKKGSKVEAANSDSDESFDSEDAFDLGEYPESEAEEDSDGSIEIGDLPSDEESKPIQKKTVAVSKSKKKKSKKQQDDDEGEIPGEQKAKKKKSKRKEDGVDESEGKLTKKSKKKQVGAGVLPSGKKSPFASFQEYEEIIERDEGHGLDQ